MKILIVTPYFPPETGGVATFVDSYQRLLREKGHEVDVLIQGSSHAITSRARADASVYEFYMRLLWEPAARILGICAFLVYFIPTLLKLNRFLQEKNIDLILIEYPLAYMYYFYLLKYLTGVKLVVGLHGDDVLSLHRCARLEQLLVRSMIRGADWVLAHSESLLSSAETIIGGMNDNKSCIPYGIEKERFRAFAKTHEVSFPLPPGPYILCVAKLDHRKGLDVLLHAIKKLESAADGCRFVIVGNGPQEDNLKRLARDLGIEKAVLFAGELPIEAVSRLYENCEFFVLPSRSEPFGIALLEAMVFGKAIITTRVGGITEFVVHEHTGIMVDSEDSDALAEQIKRVMYDPKLRARLGQNGFKLIEAKYDYRIIIDKYEDCLFKVVHKPTEPPSLRNTDQPLMPEIGVIALVPDDWSTAWQPRHHVVSRLSRYFHVVWVNPAREWREMIKHKNGSAVQKINTTDTPGFTVYTSRLLPKVYRPRWLADFFDRQRVRYARRLLAKRGCRKVVLYLWRPEFASALDFVPFDLSCYHIDDDYSFSEFDVAPDPAEVRLLTKVDQVFIHSPGLLEKKGGFNSSTVFIPNGVDYELYAKLAEEPRDLARIPHPRIGYSGWIKKQLDWPLIVELVVTHPDWHFVFVGPRSPHPRIFPIIEQLSRRHNVHFLGTKLVWDIPGYLQHFDVCVMPYLANDASAQYIYPLKLHEYLASGNPIVGTHIRSLEAFSDIAALACTVAEWSAAITQQLQPFLHDGPHRAARQAVASRYDWKLLVGGVAKTITERLGADFANRFECFAEPAFTKTEVDLDKLG